MPSDGFDDLPWPMPSGMMTKYFVASSGWPAPNNSPAKAGVSSDAAGLAGAVQHQHRLAGRLADGGVVQPQFRHGLAGVEAEILRDPVALFRRGIVGGEGRLKR